MSSSTWDELGTFISLFTSYPNERRYWMVKIAVVRVFPSLKAWICQMPEMNLAICSIFSSSLSKIFIEGCELVEMIFIHRCNA